MSGDSRSTWTDFTSDSRGSGGQLNSVFLVLPVLLTFVLSQLPESASLVGLFATMYEDGFAGGELWRGISAVVVLFATLAVGFWYLTTSSNFHKLFEGWPQGALRRMPWSNILCMASLGFCLSYFDPRWFVMPTGCLLLLLLHKARCRDRSPLSFFAVSRWLWSARWCWLTTIFFRSLQSADGFEQGQTYLLATCLVFGVAVQSLPRLSFAYCFFRAKTTAQVSFERHLWITRIERSIIGLVLGLNLLFKGSLSGILLLNLAVFGGGRWFYFLILAEVLKLPNWDAAVLSEVGPFVDSKGKILPDRRSVDDYHGPRDFTLAPVDRFGDGELMIPLQQAPERVAPRSGLVSLEVLLATMLLVLCVLFKVSLNDGARDAGLPAHYAIRSVEVGMGKILIIPDNFEGLHDLCEASGFRQRHIHTPVDRHFGLILLGGVFLSIWSRWSGTLLSMWGLGFRQSQPHTRCLGLAWVAVLAVGSFWGWFWFPSGLAFLTLGFAYWASTPGALHVPVSKFQAFGDRVKSLFSPIVSQADKVSPTEPRTFQEAHERVKGLIEIKPIILEVGVGLVGTFGQDTEFLELLNRTGVSARLAHALGVESPRTVVRVGRHLKPNVWRVHVRGSKVGEGEFPLGPNSVLVLDPLANTKGVRISDPATGEEGLWIQQESAATVKEQGSMVVESERFLAESFLSSVGPHLSELVSRDFAQRILVRAFNKVPELATRINQEFFPGDLPLIMRGLLSRGLPLSEYSKWMKPLLSAQESYAEDVVERLAQSMISAGAQPLDWLKDENEAGPIETANRLL